VIPDSRREVITTKSDYRGVGILRLQRVLGKQLVLQRKMPMPSGKE
jgi:hypothetical protein